MIQVGIIGAGEFGAAHARAIAQLDNVKLVAASRRNKAALASFTKQFGGQGYVDYRELLANTAVDAVVIATPHHHHTQIAQAAAAAGKHILLEKPMAPTLDECNAILQSVQQAHVKLMLGHVNHFVPAYRLARNIIESGELGEVVYGVSTMSKQWMNPNRREWHISREQGGGMWLTIGVHLLDILTWLINSPISSITAEIQTRFHTQSADDIGVALLRYENGTIATAVTVGYQTGVFHFGTELTGTKGMLRINPKDGVFIGQGEQWQAIPDSGSENWMSVAMVEEWRAFLDAIEFNTQTAVTGEFGCDIMAAVFAAEKSAQEKQTMKVSI